MSGTRELRYMAVYVRAALPETAPPEIWGVFAFCKINYVVFPTELGWGISKAPAQRAYRGRFRGNFAVIPRADVPRT